MIPVLFVVTILVFSIIRFIPGEPARLILGEKATEEAVAALTEKLGLNEPLLTQYLLFLKQIFTLDFGNSFTYQMPVSELLASRFPVTLALTLMSTVISLVISLPLGYFAGVHKDRLGDQVVRTTSLVAISMPSFWVGLLLMIVFGFWFVTEVSCQIIYGDIEKVFHIEESIRKMKDAELEEALKQDYASGEDDSAE